MYCSLDKIDLAAVADERPVAVQTDHRSSDEIEAEPELSALLAMARVVNARTHLADSGQLGGVVHYVVAHEPPAVLRDALAVTGAVLELPDRTREQLGPMSDDAAAALADLHFAALARRAAARIGTRDLAIALRMLEQQTFAAAPERDDEAAYWRRVLELAALAGELLRTKFPGSRWIVSDRAVVPFGFQLPTGAAIMFPTNRAQRVIEDGADESLFKLLLAADETTQQRPDAVTGKLMPSLRDRRTVDVDELVWRTLLETSADELPIVVCGIDGENTFGMIRRAALDRTPDEAMAEALRNLADDAVDVEQVRDESLPIIVVSGSFYASEKLLDRDFLLSMHQRLRADILAAAVPLRGLLLLTSANIDPTQMARFIDVVEDRYEAGGGRAISPAVLLVSDGEVTGFVHDVPAPSVAPKS